MPVDLKTFRTGNRRSVVPSTQQRICFLKRRFLTLCPNAKYCTGKTQKESQSLLCWAKKHKNKTDIMCAKKAFPSAHMHHTNLRVILVVATNFLPGTIPIVAPMSLSGSVPALRSSATYSCQLPEIERRHQGRSFAKISHARNALQRPLCKRKQNTDTCSIYIRKRARPQA